MSVGPVIAVLLTNLIYWDIMWTQPQFVWLWGNRPDFPVPQKDTLLPFTFILLTIAMKLLQILWLVSILCRYDAIWEVIVNVWQQSTCTLSAFTKTLHNNSEWFKWSGALSHTVSATQLWSYSMVLRRELSLACAFMFLSHISVTSWPLFLDWPLIYCTPNRPPAHSKAHKRTEAGTGSEVSCSVEAICAFLHCSFFLNLPYPPLKVKGQILYCTNVLAKF